MVDGFAAMMLQFRAQGKTSYDRQILHYGTIHVEKKILSFGA